MNFLFHEFIWLHLLSHILISLWENPAASIGLGKPGEAQRRISEGEAHGL